MVGESLKSHWVIVARPNVTKVEDLKGKTLGYGRAGSADYDEGAAVLRRVFKMEVGKDYKVISFQGEPERVAALVNGDIEAALISIPHAPKALNAGMKLLLRTGDLHPARRRHVLDAQGLCRPEPRDGREVHPRHRQGRDVLPRQQGRLAQEPQGASRRRRRQGRRPRSGSRPTTRSAPSFPRTCSARSSNRGASRWSPPSSGRRTSRCPTRSSS